MEHGPFAGLVLEDQVGEVTLAFERAIAASFIRRPHFLHLTRASAVKDRFKLCEKIFRVLRGDLKWSLSRVKDHLLPYLVRALDGDASWESAAQAQGTGMWNPARLASAVQ